MTTPPRIARMTLLALVVLVAIASFGKQLMWASLIPVGQHPDEQVHAVYADDLAREGTWTTSNRVASAALDQTLTNSAFFDTIFDADAMGSMDDQTLDARARALAAPDADARETVGAHGSTASAYPPASYGLYALAIRVTDSGSYVGSFYAERFISVLLATVTAVVSFFVFLRVLGSLWVATSATMFLTLMPMYSAIEASINPDVLLNLCGAVLLLQLAALLHDPLGWRLHLGIGATLAVAMLTKPAAISLYVPYAVVFLLTRAHPDWNLRRRLRAMAIGLAPTVVGYGGWRIASLGSEAISADPLASLPAAPINLSTVTGYARFLLGEGRFRFGEMFWGVFGWLDTPMPTWYLTIGWYLLVALGCLVAVRLLRDRTPSWVWVFISAAVSVAGLLFFVELRVLAATGLGMVQGRYFFVVLPAIVACWYWALTWLLEGRPRVRSAVFVLLPVAMLAAQVLAVFRTILPRYYL